MTAVNAEQLFRELDTIKAMIQEFVDSQRIVEARVTKAERKIAVIWALLALIGTGILGIGVPVALALNGH